MKKSKLAIAAIAVLSSALFMLSGCSSGSSANSPSDTVQRDSTAPSTTKKLVIGFDAEYPPYSFKADDGSYTGFDIDLATAAAEANGWTFEAKPIDWSERDAELESGNITCIWSGFTMEGREGKYVFSEPYMVNEQVVVVRAHSGIEKLDDLAGKKVITQASSAAMEVLNGPRANLAASFDGASPKTADDYNDAFLQLDSKSVDAVACDLSYAAYQISQTGDKYFMIDEPLSVEHYAVGFNLSDEETAKAVTNTLKALYEEGIVEQLCKKYEGYGLSFTNWALR